MTESAVLRVVSEILGISKVDVNASFIALGGDSIAAINVVRRLHRATGVEMDALDVLSCDSIGELSDEFLEAAECADVGVPDASEKG